MSAPSLIDDTVSVDAPTIETPTNYVLHKLVVHRSRSEWVPIDTPVALTPGWSLEDYQPSVLRLMPTYEPIAEEEDTTEPAQAAVQEPEETATEPSNK